MDGEVGEEAALGVRVGALDQVEAGDSDGGVSERAETVDEDSLHCRMGGQCLSWGWGGGCQSEYEGDGAMPLSLMIAVASGSWVEARGLDGASGSDWY